ncbi:MAG: energy-coupling factor ABC transporter ATP-binding protein [Thermodesulfobacteriota bacterium]
MGSHQPLIQLEGICYGYPGQGEVLSGLDLFVHPGDRIGLVAPNGSGKTTLFHIIMGLLKPSAGSITLFGNPIKRERDFAEIRHRIGLLFQDADDQLFSPTVLEDVAFGPLNMGKSKEEAIEISCKTLERLGLGGFEDRITYKLSGGEKRMVALATILAMSPAVLLLDEPTSGLDDQTKNRLKDILLSLDLAYILISHEFEFLAATTHKIFTMESGRILTDQEIQVHRHEHAHLHGKQPHRHM